MKASRLAFLLPSEYTENFLDSHLFPPELDTEKHHIPEKS